VNSVVIGAGPYGLACAAHLRAAGVATHVVGEPMDFWRRQMPAGMRLRSSWEASSIASPNDAWSLDAFEAERGRQIARPIPLKDFLDYAEWYRDEAVAGIDGRRVVELERVDDEFLLRFDSGPPMAARRVILATGLNGFERRPPAFSGLPHEAVMHSADPFDPAGFAGLRVAVVGAGQSAIETAVLLAEAGAQVEVLARTHSIRWLRRSKFLHERSGPLRRVLYPTTDVGPPVLNWIVAKPYLFRTLPLRAQARVAYRSIRPAASGWLVPRTGRVKITTAINVVAASAAAAGVTLELDDGTARAIDRVVLGTGFEIDVARHSLVRQHLAAGLQTRGGYPVLRFGFESSVPGLHFVGAAAAESFGPVMRFVSGTRFTSALLTEAVTAPAPSARRRPRPVMAAATQEER
jgi:hypothetical protein